MYSLTLRLGVITSYSIHYTKLYDEVVINLGAQAGVRYSLEDPYTYVQSNIVGFVNLLEKCRKQGIKHFVYASSSYNFV